MNLILPTPAEAPAVLRALYTAAVHDGPLEDRERQMLSAAQEIIGGPAIDALQPISPAALAAALPRPEIRHQVVTAMVIMGLLDEAPSVEDADLIDAHAAALEVAPAELRNLRQMAEGQLFRFKLDVARRVWLVEHLREAWDAGGLRWLARAVGAKVGLAEDADLAERYRALADYPEGTVGREYHDAMRGYGFPLPGEKGSVVEAVVIHDLTHLLGGYGTDPEGEILTAGFSAGIRREQPFTYLFFVLCQFHLGTIQAPFQLQTTGGFDPAGALHAVRRGMAVTVDLSSGWDPWTIMDLPLDEARTQLGVPPA
jgi:hypothetical protein